MPNAQCPMPNPQFVTSVHCHSKLSSVIPLGFSYRRGVFGVTIDVVSNFKEV
ncbi:MULTISPECIES: hypothetical protein [unclassified Nostoc]|uniref:hypothetical protein n=1 Tax=unclassified Nostoc TaxID=2593658 RepID=UPI0026295D30|nr:hypothetical protein [Nostoc sp. S13]MDF5736984.1 hypothetical protein [Nostoc sp. S13]